MLELLRPWVRPEDIDLERSARLADRDVVVVAEDAPEPKSWLQETGAPAVLVRPDRCVLGAARSMQELNALAAAV